MSNASLKEQLEAVASQLSDTVVKTKSADKIERSHQVAKKTFARVERRPDKPKSEKPKPKWLEQVQYGVELLKAYFPLTFLSGNQVKPLKKGIKQDLILHLSTLPNVVMEDKACMVKSLAYYVNTMSYLRSVVQGAHRLDLIGNNAGIVSEEEAKYSSERYLSKLKAKKPAGPSQKSEDKEALEVSE